MNDDEVKRLLKLNRRLVFHEWLFVAAILVVPFVLGLIVVLIAIKVR